MLDTNIGDSLIPASKISTLSQGTFVGAVADNFDEKIEQKIFHSQIVVDTVKVEHESKNYMPIPQIRSFLSATGEDTMDKEINENYRRIKLDVSTIITTELRRIKNDPELAHLIRKDE